jgi:hypothetical protein
MLQSRLSGSIAKSRAYYGGRMTRHLTDHHEELWGAYTRALVAHQAAPSDEAKRYRLIATYARFCEAFDPASADINVQTLIWRIQKTRRAA